MPLKSLNSWRCCYSLIRSKFKLCVQIFHFPSLPARSSHGFLQAMSLSTESCAFSGRKTFCLVTGASRGLGKAIAIAFSQLFAPDSTLLLTGRDQSNLESTRTEILAKSPQQKVRIFAIDLSDLKQLQAFEENLKSVLNSHAASFEQGVVVHNAASLTVTGGERTVPCVDLVDSPSVSSYFDLNLSSCISVNAIFLKYVTENTFQHRFVVQMSTLAALQPFKTWSLYCASKAARDMFFKVLALEEPSIRVLNYAPGPCKTDMGTQTYKITGDKEISTMMQELFKNDGFLDCETSIAKLVKFLETDGYASGSHVDFYDEI